MKNRIHGGKVAYAPNADQCGACGLCVTACPENAINLVKVSPPLRHLSPADTVPLEDAALRINLMVVTSGMTRTLSLPNKGLRQISWPWSGSRRRSHAHEPLHELIVTRRKPVAPPTRDSSKEPPSCRSSHRIVSFQRQTQSKALRSRIRRFGSAKPGGLTQFGAFIEVLQPGCRSSIKHWHSAEDEMV
ncbi:4Fe-4S binding protein [Roseateles chitinivorans]|uniref:4Fe-4S binding protein n=1 Tax=Roseateles chitinivorans TaxID=2917965 RepID=UPI003D67DC68